MPHFDGLNLTWETLEGLAKHNGPLHRPPGYIAEYDQRHELELGTHAAAEAQIAALADDIAYHSHDLDDGMRARPVRPGRYRASARGGRGARGRAEREPRVPPPRLRHETIRRVIDAMVTDLLAETGRRLIEARTARLRRDPPLEAAGGRLQPADGGGPPRHQGFPDDPHVPPLAGQPHEPQGAAWSRRCSRSCTPSRACCRTIGARAQGRRGTARAAATVCDYIAGMTDRYAMDEHRRLTDLDGSRLSRIVES